MYNNCTWDFSFATFVSFQWNIFWEIKRMPKEMLSTRSPVSETFLFCDILLPLAPHYLIVPQTPLWGEDHTNGMEIWYQVGSWCLEHGKKNICKVLRRDCHCHLSLSAALWIRIKILIICVKIWYYWIEDKDPPLHICYTGR